MIVFEQDSSLLRMGVIPETCHGVAWALSGSGFSVRMSRTASREATAANSGPPHR